MVGALEGRFYLGCATDSKFVDMTCAMLSSVEDAAEIPEAIILVADFDLTPSERLILRESAGELGRAMQFIPVTRDSDKIVALPAFNFPFPLMGRLVLPREITTPGSRLLLLDSDMVVNAPLRPLVDMNMAGHPVAAVEDPYCTRHRGRTNYFNAGMMLLDLDRFNESDLAAAAMRWLAACENKPDFLDQDALNEVVAGNWLKLDRRWNYFHAGDDRHFYLEDYQQAFIVHYAGRKPWEEHMAGSMYYAHLARAQDKTRSARESGERGGDRVFLADCYETLLGRELESENVAAERAGLSAAAMVRSVVDSDEFRNNVYAVVKAGGQFRGLFEDRLTLRDRLWAMDRLPILAATRARIAACATRRDVIRALVTDPHLMSLAGVKAVEDAEVPQVAEQDVREEMIEQSAPALASNDTTARGFRWLGGRRR